jgi:ATP-binding cassette subfamily B protein
LTATQDRTVAASPATEEPALPPLAPPEPHWFRRLIRYCTRYPVRLTITLTASVIAMAATAALPLIQRSIVDGAILSHRSPLGPLVGLLIVAALVAYAGSYLRRFLGGRMSLDVQHDIRLDVFAAISHLDGRRQDQLDTGQVIGRTTSDITMVQSLLALGPVTIGNLLLFVISLIVMCWLSPLLTLVALAVGPGLYVVAALSRRTLFPATWEAQQQAGVVAGVVNDAVVGVRVVKGFGQEEQELDKVSTVARRLYASRLRAVRLTARYNPVLQAVPALGQVGVLALGGWLAVRGDITLGTFLAFATYLAQLIGPVRMLSTLLTLGQQARASVTRVFELIDTRPTITDQLDATTLAPAGPPRLELRGVDFAYEPGKPVLRGLDLVIEPGETVALVGTAGSGKSTIASLLQRFYDPDAGSVLVDGRDISTVTRSSLRTTIASVLEETFLFSVSVTDNIAFGRPGASADEVAAVAQAAQAEEFILRLPDGYDTVVGEQGLTLSGGQRQRVAIARALLADPLVLVLDDATSALDARVEAQIHEALAQSQHRHTTVLIAHRRSTVALADRILVLDEGRIVDDGTYEQLWQRSALFRSLLAGPGPDESIEDGPRPAGGVTRSLWRDDVSESSDYGYRTPGDAAGGGFPSRTAGAAFGGRALRGGGGALAGALAGVPPSPELLARVATLPPATGTPNVDEAAVRAPAPMFTLGRLLGPMRWPLLLAFGLVALDSAASLVLPLLTRQGVDHGVELHQARVIAVVSLIGLAIVLVDLLINVIQVRVAGRTGERLLYSLRVKSFAHLQRLGLDYYEREMTGRIMTRMTSDIDAFSTFLQTGLTTALVSMLTFIGVLIVLLALNVELGLVVLITMPVMLVATLIFRAGSARAYTQARERLSAVYAYQQENLAGVRVVQAFRREGVNLAEYGELSNGYRVSRVRAQLYISIFFPFVQLLSTVGAALALIVGGPMVTQGRLSAGALLAFVLYIDIFFSPVQQLSQVFDGYQQAAVGLRRIQHLLRTPTSTPNSPDAEPVTGPLRGEIAFNDVRFRYSSRAPEAVAGLTLHVRPGETLALVGQTGAGKSTVVKLVSRFYDVTGGSVTVDGVDVRAYDLAGYRHRIGLVPQEAYLFPGTVRDSIAYGRPEATDAEVEAAARAVGAHDMIAELPGGYRHQVGERGRNLSSGQRQLLALARAELVDPDILLMDEATAALDLATEASVTRAAERLAKRRTTLVVAHRLTTAARADRIAVLAHGQLAEIGSHDELLAANGLYAEQWRVFTADSATVH